MVVFLSVCSSEHEVEEEGGGEGSKISVYVLTFSITVPLERGVHAIWDLKRREKRDERSTRSNESGSETAARLRDEKLCAESP